MKDQEETMLKTILKRVVLVAVLVIAVTAIGSLLVSTPQARPCVSCPDVPIPDECPACYQWVPETCERCGHCEKIKGCRP